MKLRLPWKHKRKPIKINGLGQMFEYQGNEIMLESISWDLDRGYELRLVSTKRYKNEA